LYQSTVHYLVRETEPLNDNLALQGYPEFAPQTSAVLSNQDLRTGFAHTVSIPNKKAYRVVCLKRAKVCFYR